MLVTRTLRVSYKIELPTFPGGLSPPKCFQGGGGAKAPVPFKSTPMMKLVSSYKMHSFARVYSVLTSRRWYASCFSGVRQRCESWRTPETQRSKELCVEICILSGRHVKEYSLGYIHATTPIGKLAPRRRSSGLSAWNAPC